jgi:NADPH:quinone reductase-like Zn-dependent oxidoreductase
LVATGHFQPVVDNTYSLEQIGEAHQRMEKREQFGKLIVTPSV